MPRLTKDDIGKRLMGRNDIFASVFNLLLYGGEQVIKPENLSDVPVEEIFYSGDESEKRIRDVFKMVTLKEDSQGRYLFLGIENQSTVDPYMILRIMLYDAICYMKQVREGSRPVMPSFTAVFNCSGSPWKNRKSFYDCIFLPARVEYVFKKLNGNHEILMLDPYSDSVTELEKLQHELSLVTLAMKWSKNKDRYMEFLMQDEMRNVSELVYDGIRVMNNDRFLKRIENKDGNIDMCLASKQIMEEIRAEGLAEGKLEGIAKTVKAAMESFSLDAESAMNSLKVPEEDRSRILTMLNSWN